MTGPTVWQEYFGFLSNSAGSILLSVLAGAGGSVLLELLWRPRRDRRRAASLVLTEVAFNTQLCLLQTHARTMGSSLVPADFSMSTMAWDAAGNLLSELPTALLRELILVYNQYRSLNDHVKAFADAINVHDAADRGTDLWLKKTQQMKVTIDVFNSGVDATIRNGQKLLPQLTILAGFKETDKSVPDLAGDVARVIGDRQQRLGEFRKDLDA